MRFDEKSFGNCMPPPPGCQTFNLPPSSIRQYFHEFRASVLLRTKSRCWFRLQIPLLQACHQVQAFQSQQACLQVSCSQSVRALRTFQSSLRHFKQCAFLSISLSRSKICLSESRSVIKSADQVGS